MTDTDAAPPIDPFAPDALNAVEGLDPVDPAYRHVLRIAAALNAVPLAIGASVADALLKHGYSARVADKVLGLNFSRAFKANWID